MSYPDQFDDTSVHEDMRKYLPRVASMNKSFFQLLMTFQPSEAARACFVRRRGVEDRLEYQAIADQVSKGPEAIHALHPLVASMKNSFLNRL